MFVDLGIYGISHKSDFAGREGTLRKFEKFTIDKGGFQALYAETLMDYEEFTLEHKTCDILAAERLRLMRFDNRLIIDSFQEAMCILKW